MRMFTQILFPLNVAQKYVEVASRGRLRQAECQPDREQDEGDSPHQKI